MSRSSVALANAIAFATALANAVANQQPRSKS